MSDSVYNRNYIVDLIRCIAICSVVLFHYDQNKFPLGFLGVDIFFVLSGFLFNKSYASINDFSRKSLIAYYGKRFWRIFPSLLFLILIVTVVSYLVLLPHDLSEFSKSAIASIFAVSNIFFWRTTDYFSLNAIYKPLLHTWSLGVEEQFYLLVPLVLLLFKRKFKTYLLLILVGSFCLDLWLEHHGGYSPAFFLMPTRVWQFLLGFFAFELSLCLGNFKLSPIFSAVILALLIICIFFFDQSFSMEVGLLAVGITFFLLSRPINSKFNIRFANKFYPISFLSKISYSVYLYHWPVIVFLVYINPEGVTQIYKLIYFPITFFLSIANYRFVELPFRSIFSKKLKFLVLSIAGIITIAAPAYAITTNGIPSRFKNNIVVLNNASGDNFRCSIQDLKIESYGRTCRKSDGGSHVDSDFALFGNSHAQMYFPLIFSVVDNSHNVVLYPMNGCIPSTLYNVSDSCFKSAKLYLDHLVADTNTKYLVIGTTYANATLQDQSGNLYDDSEHEYLFEALMSSVNLLKSSGKAVAVIGPLSLPSIDIPTDYARILAFGRESKDYSSSKSGDFYSNYESLYRKFEANKVILIRPDEAQCYSGKCVYISDGRSLFSDNNHISQNMLQFFDKPFRLGIAKLLGNN